MEYVTLNDGHKMPILGLGVYLVPESRTVDVVKTALKEGIAAVVK